MADHSDKIKNARKKGLRGDFAHSDLDTLYAALSEAEKETIIASFLAGNTVGRDLFVSKIDAVMATNAQAEIDALSPETVAYLNSVLDHYED